MSTFTSYGHMVILRSQNKITDFLMILAWASPFKRAKNTIYVTEFVANPADTKKLYNICTMLAQWRRRWARRCTNVIHIFCVCWVIPYYNLARSGEGVLVSGQRFICCPTLKITIQRSHFSSE